ncbi:unnamed protein product [Cercopithifilaria johnstoni]|uniref:DUF7808 domain-containing protein n=1 Tax=Cercopithifilaria johnstoni TaxID=2874296 RepID=A0A8J2M7M0_9BILA|nr:unnamed protein product [Cercopithifilaria johnstoni]
MLSAIIIILIAFINLVICTDFSKIVDWEKRTLTCFGNDIQNRADYGLTCKLAIADSAKLLETECYNEKYTEESFIEANKGNNRILPKLVRTVCDIQCKGADRDSVISKIPNSVHECVRWYNYNTLKRGDQWYIWRSGKCRNVTITFEVHCGFPTNKPNDINILAQNNISLSTKIHL